MSSRESNQRSFLIILLVVGIFIMPLGVSLNADDGLFPVTATFQKRAENGSLVQNSRRRYAKGEWVKVGGFANSTYFYGQVQVLEKRKVAGYLYAPVTPPKRESIDPSAPALPRQKQDLIRQEQVYVYGEVIRPGEFRVFDNHGTLYRLLAVEGNR